MYESGEKLYYYKITRELQCCICMKMLLCHVFRCVEIVFRKDLGPAVTLFISGQWVWESFSLCKIHRALLVLMSLRQSDFLPPVTQFNSQRPPRTDQRASQQTHTCRAALLASGATVSGAVCALSLCIVPLEAGMPSSKLWQSELFPSLPDVPSGVE